MITLDEELKVQCWDQNRFTRNDCIGKILIPIHNIQIKSIVDDWYTFNKDNVICGKIRLILQFIDTKAFVISISKEDRMNHSTINNTNQIVNEESSNKVKDMVESVILESNKDVDVPGIKQ